MKDVFTNRRNDYQQMQNNDDQNLFNNNGGQDNKPKSPGETLTMYTYKTYVLVRRTNLRFILARGDENNKKYWNYSHFRV